MVLIQRILLRFMNAMMLTREFRHNKSNQAWWSGKWVNAELGWLTLTQPIREFVCKISELTYFSVDLAVGHIVFYLQLPIIFCPFANTWHSLMLLWVKPGSQIRRQLLSKRQRARQRAAVTWSAFVFVVNFLIFAGLIITPLVANKAYNVDLGGLLPDVLQDIRQPEYFRLKRKAW